MFGTALPDFQAASFSSAVRWPENFLYGVSAAAPSAGEPSASAAAAFALLDSKNLFSSLTYSRVLAWSLLSAAAMALLKAYCIELRPPCVVTVLRCTCCFVQLASALVSSVPFLQTLQTRCHLDGGPFSCRVEPLDVVRCLQLLDCVVPEEIVVAYVHKVSAFVWLLLVCCCCCALATACAVATAVPLLLPLLPPSAGLSSSPASFGLLWPLCFGNTIVHCSLIHCGTYRLIKHGFEQRQPFGDSCFKVPAHQLRHLCM